MKAEKDEENDTDDDMNVEKNDQLEIKEEPQERNDDDAEQIVKQEVNEKDDDEVVCELRDEPEDMINEFGTDSDEERPVEVETTQEAQRQDPFYEAEYESFTHCCLAGDFAGPDALYWDERAPGEPTVKVKRVLEENVEIELGTQDSDVTIQAWRNKSAEEWESPNIRYLHPLAEVGQYVSFDGATYTIEEVLEEGIAVHREASPVGIGALLQKLGGLKKAHVSLIHVPVLSENACCYFYDPYGAKDKTDGERWIGSLCWGGYDGRWYPGRVRQAAQGANFPLRVELQVPREVAMNTKILPQTLLRLWVDPRRIVLIAEKPEAANDLMRRIPLGTTTPSAGNETTSGPSVMESGPEHRERNE